MKGSNKDDVWDLVWPPWELTVDVYEQLKFFLYQDDEKILRGLAVGISLTMYGRLEEAGRNG